MNSPSNRKKMKPAAKFLLVIASLVGFFIVAAILFGVWANSNSEKMLQLAFTPDHPFETAAVNPLNYDDDTNWAALPTNLGHASAKPEGIFDITMVPQADVFFVHPTTYLNRNHWNDLEFDDPESNGRLFGRVLKIQASAFNSAGRIFAPRYRQATFGAFFDENDDGAKALALAYADVLAAFDNFIETRSIERPFILAGHSQGSLHLLNLLRDRISNTPLRTRLIAAYIIGWPVSIEADLGALPDIGACRSDDETGCVVSYQTFGEGGDPSGMLSYVEASIGLGGMPRKATNVLCTNPQNWAIGGTASTADHLGALILPDSSEAPLGKPLLNFTGSKCGNDGVLYLAGTPGEAWQDFKLQGENFHVYDYHMFYMNIRENAATRALTWLGKQTRRPIAQVEAGKNS